MRCHQEVVAAVFLRVWIFYPLQHHLRACSRSHRCPSLELSCRLLDSSQLEYKPIPAPQPPTLLCLLSLPGGFLSTRGLCSACVGAAGNYRGLMRNWSPCIDTPASLSLGEANPQKNWMLITCSHPYWLPSSLPFPPLTALPGVTRTQAKTTCIHILSSGSAFGATQTKTG